MMHQKREQRNLFKIPQIQAQIGQVFQLSNPLTYILSALGGDAITPNQIIENKKFKKKSQNDALKKRINKFIQDTLNLGLNWLGFSTLQSPHLYTKRLRRRCHYPQLNYRKQKIQEEKLK
ncbi:hypothetical protein PPERSA_07895 [Pseudocohnilembus persalinus]|uniref:Uncharacterized protein n=1 Tax=Pseudocohnilembus persalinus TaxID=266149 RepID=A0A0V0Q7E9_PSEPJ|nr:hypothetical protein PPERSA_07895 [Pseudocohnilembus persalinus]|eukprot:KRW98090.1 hypothetical protein PPERSA_07895 [Pseudocohnilembus persalinus]